MNKIAIENLQTIIKAWQGNNTGAQNSWKVKC